MKSNKPTIRVVETSDGITEIHIKGDHLSISIYQSILNCLKELGMGTRKSFVVNTPTMLLLIKESIPSEYYEKIIISASVDGEEFRRYAS